MYSRKSTQPQSSISNQFQRELTDKDLVLAGWCYLPRTLHWKLSQKKESQLILYKMGFKIDKILRITSQNVEDINIIVQVLIKDIYGIYHHMFVPDIKNQMICSLCGELLERHVQPKFILQETNMGVFQNFNAKLTKQNEESSVRSSLLSESFEESSYSSSGRESVSKQSETSMSLGDINSEDGITKVAEKAVRNQITLITHDTEQKETEQKQEQEEKEESYMLMKEDVEIEIQEKCMLCFVEISQENYYNLGCADIFCIECMEEYIRYLINRGTVDYIVCPAKTCIAVIDEERIRLLIKNEEYQKYKMLKLNNLLHRAQQFTFCYNKSCSRALRGSEELNNLICMNCSCQTCWSCGRRFHKDQSCHDIMVKEYDQIFSNSNQQLCKNCKDYCPLVNGMVECIACGISYCVECLQESGHKANCKSKFEEENMSSLSIYSKEGGADANLIQKQDPRKIGGTGAKYTWKDYVKIPAIFLLSPLIFGVLFLFGFTIWFTYYSPCSKKVLDKLEQKNCETGLFLFYIFFFLIGLLLTPVVIMPIICCYVPKFIGRISKQSKQNGTSFFGELYDWWKTLDI